MFEYIFHFLFLNFGNVNLTIPALFLSTTGLVTQGSPLPDWAPGPSQGPWDPMGPFGPREPLGAPGAQWVHAGPGRPWAPLGPHGPLAPLEKTRLSIQ